VKKKQDYEEGTAFASFKEAIPESDRVKPIEILYDGGCGTGSLRYFIEYNRNEKGDKFGYIHEMFFKDDKYQTTVINIEDNAFMQQSMNPEEIKHLL